MIESKIQEISASTDSEAAKEFTELFGNIVTKPLSKKWLTKENGYQNIFRFYE